MQDIGIVFDGQAIGFGLNLLIDSFTNTGKSFAWDAYVAQFAVPWGAIDLGAALVLFPKTLKKPIEKNGYLTTNRSTRRNLPGSLRSLTRPGRDSRFC
ncbi:MAG: hypothetical protein P8K83_02780, partial [Woeseiaceae bacterium]|nr:hypothetical protein [Woeseiaceae bacterium]